VSYRVAPIFLIRLAGAPFDTVERLATPVTANTVRDLLVTQEKIDPGDEKGLAITLHDALDAARRSLLGSARTILPRYLIFGAEGMRDRISSLLEINPDAALPARNSRSRERERHLVLYLQRIAAKNDTFSEFGPSGWGKIGKNVSGVGLKPEPGIAKREAFLERWTSHAVAAAINADPENSNPKLTVPAHTPRLRCGKVIVQRRSWTVKAHDLIPGDYTGVSNQLIVAVEKLRAERNLPRFIYIRPTEQALRRSGAEGRDKDTKPVFVDLESYLFLEIFHRWLIKAGEIEVTELLPDPEHLFWKESNGRHSFELSTLIVPRS
jgi:hypothetical protein